MCKEFFKDLMTLDKEIFVPKFAMRLKKYINIIYAALVAVLGIFVLCGLIDLLSGQISIAILKFCYVLVSFIVVRMFCEFLKAHQ